jgi:hypothetical protein
MCVMKMPTVLAFLFFTILRKKKGPSKYKTESTGIIWKH